MTKMLFIMLALSVSCQMIERKQPVKVTPSQATFESAVNFFRQGKYEESLKSIEAFREAYPQNTKLVETLYLKGRNERFLGKYVECLETFHGVIELTKIKKDSYYHYALYQSGLCYELIGDTEKAIAVYQDSLRSVKNLPSQLKDLEIPSRLALSYSKIGEAASADKYYKKLQVSLKDYLSKKDFSKEEKEFYAEILFGMSVLEISIKDQQDFATLIKALEITQQTLLQLLKLNLAPYTQKALAAYVQNYRNLHEYLVNIRVYQDLDPILEQRGRQQFQKEMALKVLENIEGLEVLLTPEMTLPELSKEFEALKDVKQKFELMSVQRLSGDGLTPEAESKQTLKKDGKVIDKPTILEEKALEGKK